MPTKRIDDYDGSTNTEGIHHMAIRSISAKRRKELLSLDDGMAERIKELMEQLGILDRDLARALNVADRTIYNWKTTGQVSRKLLPLLAEYLHTSTEYLVTGGDTDQFQKRTEDHNVVQMERSLDAAKTVGSVKSLITRYVGIYEHDELVNSVQKNPQDFRNSLHNFVDRPQSRTSIAITLNPDQLNLPGIPAFAFQFMVDYFKDFNIGDYIAYAPDIVPSRGKFCAVAYRLKGNNPDGQWTWANGYYVATAHRQVSSNMGENFFAIRDFSLKIDPDKTNEDDVHITPDYEFALVGTATYLVRWLDQVQILKQTGLRERLDTSYESRRNLRFCGK